MVKRIINLLGREFGSINQAAFLLGFFAFLSQLLGLIRDRSLAHYLGPSSALDIYYAAFRVPDFIFISIASLASFTVLIPFLTDKLQKGGTEKAREFLSNIFKAFLIVMMLVSAVAFIFMPILVKLVAPGFAPKAIFELVTLSRIMLLSPIFLGLSNLFGTVTQIYNKFFIYALSPILYNLGILVGVLIFLPIWGLPGLALGVVLGALFHFVIQVPVVIRQKFIPSFSFKFHLGVIKEIMILSLPRTIGLAANNLSLIVLLALASLISEGAVSIFNLSMNLQLVPVTIVGVSYSVAVFPTLARSFSVGDIKNFTKQVSVSARQIIFWSLPMIFLFIVLRAQIVRVVLGSGRFDWSHTKLTAAALALFALSVLAQSLVLLLVRGYYAAGRTRRPLFVNMIFSALTITFAFILLYLYDKWPGLQLFLQTILRVPGEASAKLLMLPLAYTLGTTLNFLVLWRFFRRDFIDHELTYLSRVFWQGLVGSFAIGLVAYTALGVFDNIFDINTFWGIFGQGFFSGILGLATGILALYLLKSQELVDIWKTIHSKFWRTEVIVPAQENLQNVDKI